jgi:hypothetical protein
MANSSLTLSSLDFDTLKQNFKTYLKEQSVFKDYDFDASNINVLLDVMSYNSYLNSFYLNMIASEMFMDSAQKLDTVVSHAKELNYVPQSKKSSVAFLNFSVSCNGISGSFQIPKGTIFYGSNANGLFNFTTSENATYYSPNSNFSVANLAVYDGTYQTDSFIIDWDVDSQNFLLSSPDIDISSLTVTVSENNGSNNTTFRRSSDLFGLISSSNVYFLQGSQNNQYEVLFGDGYFGRKPQNKSVLTAEYRIVSGPDADGVTSYSISGDLGALNGGTASLSTITTTGSSSGGRAETIEDIKFRAPRYYAAQQRAVSSDDFTALVLSRYGGEISDVIVYGGQELEPKQYGRVAVCVKPTGTTVAPDYLKSEIVRFLTEYIVLPNRVIVTDPDYFYIDVISSVEYNTDITNKFPADIKTAVTNAMLSFSDDHIEKFGNDFRYSKFVAHIDNTDISITSNDTKVRMVKRVMPLPNFNTSYTILFNNTPERESYYNGITFVDARVLISSKFTYNRADGRIFYSAYLQDDGAGNVAVYYDLLGETQTVEPNLGTIDYDTGKVILDNLNVADYGDYISLYLTPQNKDIIASQNMVLILEPNDISITVSQTTK